MGVGPDPDARDDNPDLWDLFRHYDKLYFRGALADAGFSVEWAFPRTKTITSFGSCSFGDLSKITLYKPMLQYRTNADLKNALLHLMIHAIIFVKHGLTSLGHGPVFRDWMDAINTCPIEDYVRPISGYCITTTHDFSREKSCNIQGFLWKCESCGDTLVRAKKLGPPSDSCCIENVSQHATCGNMLCHWHNRKMDCGGTYLVTKPPVTPGPKMAPKGRLGLLTETTEMSKSQGAVQQSDSDSDSDGVQENFTKPNAEGKLLSQVRGSNTKSPGSGSSLKKAGKSNMPEDFQKAIVLSAAPRRRLKPKQEFVGWEKHEHLLTGSCNNAKSLGSSSSKKADDFQKAIVLSAAPRSRLKRKQASEEHGFFSLGSCNNANSSTSNTSRKDVQKSSVQPSASQKKLKLEQDLVASEKHGVAKPSRSITTDKVVKLHKPEGIQKTCGQRAAPLTRSKPNLVALEKNVPSSVVGCGNAKVVDNNISSKTAHKKHDEDEGTQKHISRRAAPSTLKQPAKTSSSLKARKQHKPEDFPKISVQPAVPRSKLKQSSHAAPERQTTRSKARGLAKKKEYVCFSLWQNFYESECSSGSAEPLVNKRTVRRKKERERLVQIACSRSRKRCTSGIGSIKAQPDEEVSSGQTKPPSLHLEVIVIDDEVMAEAPRGQSKPAAPSKDVAVVPPADQVMAEAPRGQSQPPAPSTDVAVVVPADQVVTQAPSARGQSQPPTPSMDIVIPPADHRDRSDPSTSMDIAAVAPAGQVMVQARADQSQPPAPCSISADQVVPLPPHSADPPCLTPSNPSSWPAVIDISDDDDD